MNCFKLYRNSKEYKDKWRKSIEKAIPSISEKSRNRMKELYRTNPEKKRELTEAVRSAASLEKSAKSRKGWFDRAPEETKNKYRKLGKELGTNKEIRKRTAATCNEKYGSSSPFSSKEVQSKKVSTYLERYGVDNPLKSPSIRHRAHSKLHDNLPMKTFESFLITQKLSYSVNVSLSGKDWDFVIYKNGEPDVAVEIDGEFYHGHTCDPFYSKQTAYLYDNERLGKLPDGIKPLVVDSNKVKDSFPELLRLIGLDYEKWIQEMLEACTGEGFPYPVYSPVRMRKDWENLKKSNPEQYHRFLMPGNSIVTSFHKSIYSSKKYGHPSPVDAWNNPELLEKCIRNRSVYKSIDRLSSYQVARGFEKNGVAPRVSVFQPALARFLLMKFSPEARTCVDPFSGFSGRLLGAVSLGMHYTGYEIREDCVRESMDIVDFLGISDLATVTHMDSGTCQDSNEYDVLITCPPYGNKEIWLEEDSLLAEEYVDMALNTFKAKVYIFIVDKPGKYAGNVIMQLDGRSHFGTNSEKVLVFRENSTSDRSCC
jgi:DNA modification methylase